ncbi:Immunoglobulin-binding protein 1 [Cyberlindnera fabianii]|uniref:Immunoglobulin-binding protein 1 n=1 Tax=Cyberlindnera fabianii TaxID=36022 RepID=A0A1V2L568_CYBFA|nr:Immunoglobulin-binding protein 1 [Cyberlindnera fabianii]
MSQQRSLKQIYTDCQAEFTKLESAPFRHDSDEYQAQLSSTIQHWIDLKSSISSRAIFSSNESIEDVNTSEIKYLATDYFLAQLYAEFSQPAKTINIRKAILCYLHFFTNLQNYGLLTSDQETKYDKLKERPFDIPVLHETAMLRREDKIANFRMEKQLSVRLQALEKLEDDDNEYQNADDEVVRELYLDQLRLFVIRTFDNIRNLTMELEILQNIPEPKVEEVKDDDREKKRDNTNFTERLESVDMAVMDKKGKILRPFTLMKRDDLKKKVFGTGQYLPTVTVEEFLEQELANGGVISGGGNDGDAESSDEDDMEKADRETYKKREWDEFTESHAKGSGNTMNRG